MRSNKQDPVWDVIFRITLVLTWLMFFFWGRDNGERNMIRLINEQAIEAGYAQYHPTQKKDVVWKEKCKKVTKAFDER